MQQMCSYVVTAIFLIVCIWQDLRTGRISGRIFFWFGVGGMLFNILFGSSIPEILKSILPGVCLFVFSRLSGEQIGYGDGFVIGITGLYLRERRAVSLFCMGLLLCAFCTMILFAVGKIYRKTEIPFLPFLMAGFIVQILFQYKI